MRGILNTMKKKISFLSIIIGFIRLGGTFNTSESK